MLRVLIVCTANVCRSPLVETLLRARTAGAPLMYDSAGVLAAPGAAMDPRIVAAAGLSRSLVSHHRSRRLDEIALDRRDLVLTADRGHRRAVVQANPRVSKRTFTLREFARLVQATDLDAALVDAPEHDRDRLGVVLSRLRDVRPANLPAVASDDDLADPHGGSDADYQRCLDVALPMTQVVGAALERIVSR